MVAQVPSVQLLLQHNIANSTVAEVKGKFSLPIKADIARQGSFSCLRLNPANWVNELECCEVSIRTG